MTLVLAFGLTAYIGGTPLMLRVAFTSRGATSPVSLLQQPTLRDESLAVRIDRLVVLGHNVPAILSTPVMNILGMHDQPGNAFHWKCDPVS